MTNMTQYIAAFGFFVVLSVFMALMLHFSQYKKRNSGCCSDGLDVTGEGDGGSSCYTCPNKSA